MNETANHRENKMPMSTNAARHDVTACILCSRNCGLSVEVENNQFKKIKGDDQHPFYKVTFVKKQRVYSIINNTQIV